MGDLDLIGRLTKFCDEWAKMRLKGDDIYGLHIGEDREAVLCASDIRQAADEITRLREALDRQCDTMAFVLNKATLPDQWYCKFSNELEQDRAALQHKEPQS